MEVMQVRDLGSRIRGRLGGGAIEALRRTFITFITAITCSTSVAIAAEYPDVIPGRELTFPADEGSHPTYRTEWWYITGWLNDENNQPFGFQVTFFRSRPGIDEANPSRFAPKQLLFAHAALSDPRRGVRERPGRGHALSDHGEEAGLRVRHQEDRAERARLQRPPVLGVQRLGHGQGV